MLCQLYYKKNKLIKKIKVSKHVHVDILGKISVNILTKQITAIPQWERRRDLELTELSKEVSSSRVSF